MLTEENFEQWREKIVSALKSEGLWAVVSDPERVEEQFVQQMKAIQLIISSVSEDLTHLIPMEPEDPVQIWKDLVDHFESKSAFNVLSVKPVWKKKNKKRKRSRK